MLDMRVAVFAVFGLVTSGCTIHVVEAPQTPQLVAAAPAPAQAAPPRVVYVPVAAAPSPVTPRRAPPATAQPAPGTAGTPAGVTPAAVATRDPAPIAKPSAKPRRTPFKTIGPEPRSGLTSVAPPGKHRRPQKVKQDETVALVTSANVAQAQ